MVVTSSVNTGYDKPVRSLSASERTASVPGDTQHTFRLSCSHIFVKPFSHGLISPWNVPHLGVLFSCARKRSCQDVRSSSPLNQSSSQQTSFQKRGGEGGAQLLLRSNRPYIFISVRDMHVCDLLMKSINTSRSPLVMDSSSTLNCRSSTFL